ncbi:MAG: STM4011 family radical SAM protein [Lachnospiraceae bacterium]
MVSSRKTKTICYRGSLKSCNYRCSYCPFSKNPQSAKQLAGDRAALEQFCRETENYKDIGIMLLPYGEALIHSYYLEQIAGLTQQNTVSFVACQTNLSLDIDRLADAGIDLQKLRLWCSFHPSQTSVDAFIGQCEVLLRYDISFCVVAVGDVMALPVIQELRARLHPEIYLWINDMDGKPAPYTKEDIQAFTAIDPLFSLELNNLRADISQCNAGRDSYFINDKGDVFACNISKVPMGNIYRQRLEEMSGRSCRAKVCSCYLAYSNRKDMERLEVFGRNRAFRIPESGPKACFFDIDGTLTDEAGKIPAENQDAVRRLARNYSIYLATSRPYKSAQRICREIWDCIDGGIFAGGSDIRIFHDRYHVVVPLDESGLDLTAAGIRVYCHAGMIHKVTMKKRSGQEHLKIDAGKYHVVCEGDIVGITDYTADKLRGILRICDWMKYSEDDVAVIGNSSDDIAMLNHFLYAFAIAGSDMTVQNAAQYVRRIVDLEAVTLEWRRNGQTSNYGEF